MAFLNGVVPIYIVHIELFTLILNAAINVHLFIFILYFFALKFLLFDCVV